MVSTGCSECIVPSAGSAPSEEGPWLPAERMRAPEERGMTS